MRQRDCRALVDAAQALVEVDPDRCQWAASATVDAGLETASLSGRPVVPGAVHGVLCTNLSTARRRLSSGTPVVFARRSTTMDDMEVVRRSVGLVTSTGSHTSHAAIIARMWSLPTIVGLDADVSDDGIWSHRGVRVKDGAWVTLDATNGRLMSGQFPIHHDASAQAELEQLLVHAQTLEHLPGPRLYGNADTAVDVERCFSLGATGIGVARTEHMFVDTDDLTLLRDSLWGPGPLRRSALDSLCSRATDQFCDLLATCAGRPLSVRLLDPPLHEFVSADDDHAAVMDESNPMMGVRGVRLGQVYPELYAAQVRAMLDALDSLAKPDQPRLGVLVPFTNWRQELTTLSFWPELRRRPDVKVGAMIESPEAVFNIDQLASVVDFASVGTNDLVQFCLAMSRDDVSRQLVPHYLEAKIVESDPMVHLDGSKSALALLAEISRRIPSDVEWGICGEHASDPRSLRKLSGLTLGYVSASPGGLVSARLELARQRAANLLTGQKQ